MKKQILLMVALVSCISLSAKQPNQQPNQSSCNNFIDEENDENSNNNIQLEALISTIVFDIRRIEIPVNMHPQTLSNRARVDQSRRDIIDRGNAEVYGGSMPAVRHTSGSPVPTDNNQNNQ